MADKIVEVIGKGPVAFPDTMSDAEILEVLRRQSPAPGPTPPPRLITEATDPANAEPDPARPGVVESFVNRGVQAVKGLAGFGLDAAKSALTLEGQATFLPRLAKNMYEGAVDTGAEAIARQFPEGVDNLPDAKLFRGAMRGGAAAVPVIGPYVMNKVSDIEEGNWRKVVGETGFDLLSTAAPKSVPPTLGKMRAMTKAVGETAPAQKVAATAGKIKTTTKASVSREALEGAAATGITTGAITMNPLVGLQAATADLARRVIPEFMERWKNNGATLNEIKTATEVAEKEAANKLKYRGVSKGEFDQIQDHLKSLKVEAEAAAKAARAESAELKQTQRVEKVAEGREVQRQKKMSEMDQQAEAQTLKAQEAESFKSGGAEAKTQDLFQKLRERAEKAKAPAADQPPTVTVPGETGPKVVSSAAPGPDLAPARKSATAIVYAENKATGKPYTLPEIEAGIKKSHPSLTPEQVSQVAKETVADAMHVETVVGGLASRGQSITQISQFIRRAYPDLPNSKLMELAVREVQAMGDAMTPAQRAELGIVRSASNKRKLDPTTLKPR